MTNVALSVGVIELVAINSFVFYFWLEALHESY